MPATARSREAKRDAPACPLAARDRQNPRRRDSSPDTTISSLEGGGTSLDDIFYLALVKRLADRNNDLRMSLWLIVLSGLKTSK